MPILENIFDVGEISAGVYAITRSNADAASAAGYAQWIKSMTGSLPYVERDQYGRARVFLDPQQAAAMRKWIERSAIKSLSSTPEPGSLYIDFQPVIEPLLLQYGLLTVIAVAAAGFIAGRLV